VAENSNALLLRLFNSDYTVHLS